MINNNEEKENDGHTGIIYSVPCYNKEEKQSLFANNPF